MGRAPSGVKSLSSLRGRSGAALLPGWRTGLAPVLHLGVFSVMRPRVRRKGAAGGQQTVLLSRGSGVPLQRPRPTCIPRSIIPRRGFLCFALQKGYLLFFHPADGIVCSFHPAEGIILSRGGATFFVLCTPQGERTSCFSTDADVSLSTRVPPNRLSKVFLFSARELTLVFFSFSCLRRYAEVLRASFGAGDPGLFLFSF